MKSFKQFLAESASNDGHHAKVFHDVIIRIHHTYHTLSNDKSESSSDRKLFASRAKHLSKVSDYMDKGDHAKAHAHLLKNKSLHDGVADEADEKEFPSVKHFYKKHGAPGY